MTRQPLRWYTSFMVVATLFLIVAGAMVTSTGSGLSVPDWPLSYGMWMPPMVGGIFYEHGHRMVATSVGFLTIILAILLWKFEPRKTIRRLGYGALGLVIVQGILGGLTVLFLLPRSVSVLHALTGQTFFCLIVSIAVASSPIWKRVLESDSKISRRVLGVSFTLGVMVYGQLLLGAVVRHSQAGLAIPDFPFSFGKIIPPTFDFNIGIQFAHRVLGSAIFLASLLLVVLTLRDRVQKNVRALSILTILLVSLQILLGAYTIWTEKAPWIASAHVATGATILALALTMALLSLRIQREGRGLDSKTVHAFVELTKPRITMMVMLTCASGFYMASRTGFRVGLFFATVVATFLTAAGASAFNQVIEADIDGLMRRTRGRPLPTGRLSRLDATLFAILISAFGTGLFWLTAGFTTAALAVTTILIYTLVYTPLKRITPLCTLVGAIPGAMPPLIGWTAASGHIDPQAWILFSILLVWQLPHFFAIACLYKDDYASAGFAMLPVIDRTGNRTAWETGIWSSMLVPLALVPTWAGVTGGAYFVGALILGAAFWAVSLTLATQRTALQARRVLLASVVYLPLLMALMAIDRV